MNAKSDVSKRNFLSELHKSKISDKPISTPVRIHVLHRIVRTIGIRGHPEVLFEHGVPACEHWRLIIPCFVVVHTRFLVQFLGVEGIFGNDVIAEGGVVLGGDFTERSIEESLGDILVLVGYKGSGTEMVGVVVEVFPFISFLFSSPGKNERNEAKKGKKKVTRGNLRTHCRILPQLNPLNLTV